jgi:putative transposase
MAEKKITDAPVLIKRAEVEARPIGMSILRQCGLLELPRSTFYYQPLGENAYNLALMRLIDEQFTKRPFYGVPRMTAWLRATGQLVNEKRVRRLMRRMGLEAIYPKPRLSAKGADHKIYPYLLKDVTIDHPDQAWATDITYVRLAHGFVFLVAILDWSSRYVLSWELSTTLDKGFCLEVLRRALRISKPEIFNTDQGAQFTSVDFTKLLLDEGIQVSMDGRGRVFDNIFIERLWRSVKYEEVYLHDYETVPSARAHLGAYFQFYNEERLHEALGYRTPSEVYFGTRAVLAPAPEDVV